MVKEIVSRPGGSRQTDRPPRPYDPVKDRTPERTFEAEKPTYVDNRGSSDVLRDTSYQQRPAGPSRAEGGYVSGETESPWRNLIHVTNQQYRQEFGSPGNVSGSKDSDNRYVSDNELPSGEPTRKPKLPRTTTQRNTHTQRALRHNGRQVRQYIEQTYHYDVPTIEHISQEDGTTKIRRVQKPKQILEFAQKMERESGKSSNLQNLDSQSVTSLAKRKDGQTSRPDR